VLRATLLLGLSTVMTSCASLRPPIPTTVITADCGNWKTISYSAKADSAETIRQIIEQNARRKAVCDDTTR
jgi:hypothetical protein